jgi:surface protein
VSPAITRAGKALHVPQPIPPLSFGAEPITRDACAYNFVGTTPIWPFPLDAEQISAKVEADRHASPTSHGSTVDDGLLGTSSPGPNTGAGNHPDLAPRPARSGWPLRPFPAVLALLLCASSLFSPTVGLTAITDSNIGTAVSAWRNDQTTATTTWGDIVGWDTSAVTLMGYLFVNYPNVNENLAGWNTASVANMKGMFQNAAAFNQNLAGWDTASVTYMSNMFNGASSFNQNLAGWNTASVTAINSMFQSAISFNQNLGKWNTAKVVSMGSMFYGVSGFDQNLAGWNTASVDFLGYMFTGASSFNQNLAGWNVLRATFLTGIMDSTALADCFKKSISDQWGATLQARYPTWSALSITCPSCDASAAPTNGLATPCTSSLASGSSCTPTCNAGYTLAGTRTCTAGTLTTTTAVCNALSVAPAACPTLLVAGPGTMVLIF